jgi:cold shock CspA family protein
VQLKTKTCSVVCFSWYLSTYVNGFTAYRNCSLLKIGERTSFLLPRNGNIRARRMKLVKAAQSSELYQGVVCSLKDNYGFIERADIVKEIFFHFSEFQDDSQSLALGDDVEYAIQIRNVCSSNYVGILLRFCIYETKHFACILIDFTYR